MLNNFWPKLISLILAVATWFYVFDLINNDAFVQRKETLEDVFSQYKFVTKEVPVKPVFMGRSPEGYRVVFEKVIVKPSNITIFGPKVVVENVDDLKTDKINIGEYTRSVKLELGIHSNAKFLQTQNKVVEVYLPVEPVTEDAQE